MQEGKLFVVSGPSGAGKGTVCGLVMAKRRDLYFSVSMTTRGIRPGETDGVSYHFVTEDAFLSLKDAGGFLECSHHAGAWYGTPAAPALEAMKAGKNVLLEIENNGAMQVKASHPEAILVFILPPSREALIRRLVYRGTESLEKIQGRLLKAGSELEAARDYECLILNDDAETAAARLSAAFDFTYDGRAENAALLDRLAGQFGRGMDETLRILDTIYNEYLASKGGVST